MAIVLAPLAKETTTTTGTGPYSLSGVAFDADHTTFAAVINNGDQVWYLAHGDGNNFEVNIGTWSSAGNTLTRDTIVFSTNGGLPINWGAGTKLIYSVLEQFTSASFLQAANNLSDVQDAGSARNNLGALGDAGNQTVTSGSIFIEDAAATRAFRVGESVASGPYVEMAWSHTGNFGRFTVHDGVDSEDVFHVNQVALTVQSGVVVSITSGATINNGATINGGATVGGEANFTSVVDVNANAASRLVVPVGANKWAV